MHARPPALVHLASSPCPVPSRSFPQEAARRVSPLALALLLLGTVTLACRGTPPQVLNPVPTRAIESSIPLAWDPGATAGGTMAYTAESPAAGDRIFRIVAQNPRVGVWRTVLTVESGEADLYLRQGGFAAEPSGYSRRSQRQGSDGLALASAEFTPGQEWHVLVRSTAGARWTLVSGDAFVQDLGALAADGSSGASTVIPPEGIAYFKTTVPATTLAWRLWLSGRDETILVRKSLAPHPYSSGFWDLRKEGAMLVVPPYLNTSTFDGSYFIGVPGEPGTPVRLDSRQQPITDIAFDDSATTSIGEGEFPYRTYRTQVPVQQIAWQTRISPSQGDPSIAVRRETVPNEFRNDAFSEVPGPVEDSVTMVPASSSTGISDGTYYITVYGRTPFAGTLTQGHPVITDVRYAFEIAHDAPTRAGWRYYRVGVLGGTADQLGSLGWELLLAGAPPGTEIALRRNAVPGRWRFRSSDNALGTGERGYVDFLGKDQFLQRPGHQADIWYIGIYQPDSALGPFTLRGQPLTGEPLAFDGAEPTRVTGHGPDRWRYFRVEVPSDDSLLGWDLRLSLPTGSPWMAVRRDGLPSVQGNSTYVPTRNWDPGSATNWPSGYQWGAGVDWTGYPEESDGSGAGQRLIMGYGNPLQPGTYYVGVRNPAGARSVDYTLTARGIGPNRSIGVRDLPIEGTTNPPALAPREIAYFRVVVPPETKAWKLALRPADGAEALLLLHRGFLPNSHPSWQAYDWEYAPSGSFVRPTGGQRESTLGAEFMTLLPSEGQLPDIPAGAYYLAVVGEGINPGRQRIGNGDVRYTLESTLESPVLDLGTAGETERRDERRLANGELAFYAFDIAPGTSSVEIKATIPRSPGRVMMTLARTDVRVANRLDASCGGGTGSRGGANYTWFDDDRITLPNPTPGRYALTVMATDDSTATPCQTDADYVLSVRASAPALLAFDGGSDEATLASGEQRFYRIEVPRDAGVLGWDLRLSNREGFAQFRIRRDALPSPSASDERPESIGWTTNWPSGRQFAGGQDWTRYSEPDGKTPGGALILGMGNPLEPGTYFVAVANASPTQPSRFLLASRGIGTNQSIPVQDLALDGSIEGPALAPREAAFYRVVVPEGTPGWKISLQPTEGEALMLVHAGTIPNSAAGSGSLQTWTLLGTNFVTRPAGGRIEDTPGAEVLAVLPEPRYRADLMPGEYFIAVMSQGIGSQPSPFRRIGTGPVKYRLQSETRLPVTSLGTIDATEKLAAGSLLAGEMAFFQFDVAEGTLSFEVQLDTTNVTVRPWMSLQRSGHLVAPATGYGCGTSGSWGGDGYEWSDGARLTLSSPAPGRYSLTVGNNSAGASQCPVGDTSFTLRIQAVAPMPLAFDGGTVRVTQGAREWRFFRVEVPDDDRVLGWDLRLSEVTAAARIQVRRDLLPTQNGSWSLSGNWFTHTNWPSGSQLGDTEDWTRRRYDPEGRTYFRGRGLTLGMGNPLEPGTYYLGIYSGDQPDGYVLTSRGIGTGQGIPVHDLPFNGGIEAGPLEPRDFTLYRVIVPEGVPSWRISLRPEGGQAMLLAHHGFIPNTGASDRPGILSWTRTAAGPQVVPTGGLRHSTPGTEHLTVLPDYDFHPFVPPGAYYLAVVSEGDVPDPDYGDRVGRTPIRYQLSNVGPLPVTHLGSVDATDRLAQGQLEAEEAAFYTFDVPPDSPSIEVRLEGVVGHPRLALRRTERIVSPSWLLPFCRTSNRPGQGGEGGEWTGSSLITLPAPAPGRYGLTVTAAADTGATCRTPDASYTVRVRRTPIATLSFSAETVTTSETNRVDDVLADGQRAYYRVEVPERLGGQTVLAWHLDLSQTSGRATVRARKDRPPSDNDGASTPSRSPALVVATPWLTPGTWYVEVKGEGNTAFTLASRGLTVAGLDRPLWTLPTAGSIATPPGLNLPEFGDTGVLPDGTVLPGDRGIDLQRGRFHYYGIVVPPGNAGLLRTELQAISGNPNLYLRSHGVPTLDHGPQGEIGGILYDRSMSLNSRTEYANWVPLDGRRHSELEPGLWIVAVHAAGNSNVRYRLRLSCGEPVRDALVQEVPPEGGQFSGQNLAGFDWRYYRLRVPEQGHSQWILDFGRTLGGARVFFRDTTPPGDGASTYAQDRFGGIPFGQSSAQRDWISDGKNAGPYFVVSDPGRSLLTIPPLRPGSTFHIGVWSPNDTTFSLSIAPDPAVVPLPIARPLAFRGGQVTETLPARGLAGFVIDVPTNAVAWKHLATHDAAIQIRIDQGTWPRETGPAPWFSTGPNGSYETSLAPNAWPWVPGHRFYLTVRNTSDAPQPVQLTLQGRLRNEAPRVSTPIPDLTATSGVPFAFAVPDGTFTDPDPDQTLVLSVGTLPQWLAFDPNSRRFTGTPDAAGEYPIQLLATDNGIPPATAAVTFRIDVITVQPIVISHRRLTEPDRLRIEVPTRPGERYVLESTLDLEGVSPAWTDIGVQPTPFTPVSQGWDIPLNPETPHAYLRVRTSSR